MVIKLTPTERRIQAMCGASPSDEKVPFDEALANERIRVKLQALLTELALRATRTGPIPESAPVFYAIDDAREALQAYERKTNR